MAKLEAKREELALDKNRFRRETCELFVEWCVNEQAKAIATGTGDNSQKIEQLGRLMFGADWEDPKSN